MTCTPAALTLPGYLDLPLDGQNAAESCHYRATEHGPAAEAGLILGVSKDGPVRLKSQDLDYWRQIRDEAGKNVRFLEDAQRSAAA